MNRGLIYLAIGAALGFAGAASIFLPPVPRKTRFDSATSSLEHKDATVLRLSDYLSKTSEQQNLDQSGDNA